MHFRLIRLAAPGLLLALAAFGANCSTTDSGSSSNSPCSLVPIGAELSGQSGTSAEVIATGLKNVSALAEDDAGRLWIATAAFTDSGTDALYVVARRGAAPMKVVSEMHTPMGLLWLDGVLYVSSSDNVTTYTNFNGSTFGTERGHREIPRRWSAGRHGSRPRRTHPSRYFRAMRPLHA